jgi:hypothetical protein
MHACASVYVCVYEERERISVTLVTTAADKGVRVISKKENDKRIQRHVK